ncbi:hypothetical protein ABPG77_008592 [Micractinium sp. CCAP 211/92]
MRAPCASAQAALLALLLLASNSHAATAGAVLSPQDTYTVNTASGDFVLAPSVGWNGTLIRMMTTSVEACAEACRADQQCMLFNHCDVQGGCKATTPVLQYQECQLLSEGCTAMPVAGAAGPWIKRTAGFPVRYRAPETAGFVQLQAQGLAGGDLQCSDSELPDQCAFPTVEEATQACQGLSDCGSVVVYSQGVDGCSNLTAVLVSADGTAFVSPIVATLTKQAGGSGGSASSSGGLSAGAIAGIAVGAVAGAAALAGVAWVVLRRRGDAASNGKRTAPHDDEGLHSTNKLSSGLTISSEHQTGLRGASAFSPGRMGSGGGGALGSNGTGTVGSGGGHSRGGHSATAVSSSSGDARSSRNLPELAQHIAAVEARSLGGLAGHQADQHSMLEVPQPPLLSVDSLPASLNDWVFDLSEVTFNRRVDGSLAELGRGASGVVYRAMFRGEPVAAKEVQLGHSVAAQEAFVLEAERMHQLRHAHVVALYGVALSGPVGVLIMEYCGGRDLMQALELKVAGGSDRVFSWKNHGRRIAYDVAKALNFLHARGIVHLDVKSSNILLTASGTAKLGDVGLARILHSTYLSELPLVGTFAWVAPEVLMGGQNCTSAVDLYSFGVVLWEIITGEKPTRGRLRAPRVPEECPQDVADLMMECMRLDPSERPTAQQVMHRLRNMHGTKGEG